MGADQPQPSRSPLKLSLSSLPSQPRSEPPGLVTPPLQPMASVPFLWEEAPGKPRPVFPVATSLPPPKPKVARCLDLPPRLLMTEGKMTNTPSPTTVLEGPYSGGRTLSHTMSFTFGKASFRIPEGKKQIGKERGNFSSLRWEESFKENYDCESGGILDFSPSAGDFPEGFAPAPESTRTRKRSSFFGPSKSNFWTSIYESVKQAVPWRRKQEKTRRMNYSYV
ncbi:hypothetical protein RHGRI_008719 [Rhododendron griersonianum]|uniref:Uncharacterized protein n=1 Tax=Rhododendron griersonianum TaxID=479676 RepID=A0AAV6L1T2_9ERIC|nr:hypothetical protein RHGRI_008719 [Rhododendron griersonianum]